MASPSPAVIHTASLVKDYGRFRALHGVDLEVWRGEVFGFIGPNGAGKSTAIRCLLDLLRPTSGDVRLFGHGPLASHPELRSRIGYLPGELAMEGKTTARDHLAYLCELRGGQGQERIEPLAQRFDLDLDRSFHGLSKGNKQKVGLVQAFMHRPELLILDEPTSGLDPLLQKEFLALAREAREGGATLFISSHILSEVEAVADRVGIIRDGRIVATETMDDLRRRVRQSVRFEFAAPPSADAFDGVEGLEQVRLEGTTFSALLHGSPDALLKAAAAHTVVSWSAAPQSLEQLFIDHYRTEDRS